MPKGSSVPGECSSGVERSVHIGKVRGSIPRTPTTQKRKYYRVTAQNISDYFWSKVAVGRPDECWPWMASRYKRGYGCLGFGGKTYRASRLAYELATGKEAGSLMVCHHCDNPPCCNPAHLYAGTKIDNERDKTVRGRRNAPRGAGHARAKLTEADAAAIKARIREGESNVDIAASYPGVTRGAINMIRLGRNWKHVP